MMPFPTSQCLKSLSKLSQQTETDLDNDKLEHKYNIYNMPQI